MGMRKQGIACAILWMFLSSGPLWAASLEKDLQEKLDQMDANLCAMENEGMLERISSCDKVSIFMTSSSSERGVTYSHQVRCLGNRGEQRSILFEWNRDLPVDDLIKVLLFKHDQAWREYLSLQLWKKSSQYQWNGARDSSQMSRGVIFTRT
ncbi:MAG: hypothetical protein R3A11_07180 [Bdellovibrionota bacterium]